MLMTPVTLIVIWFLDLLESMGLQQHVDVPTHKSGHTLDLIITTRGLVLKKTVFLRGRVR